MTLYETTLVIDPQLKPLEIEEVIKKVTSFIANHGGEIVKVDEWGKRRLAYEINKKQYGYYVHIRFRGPGQLIKLLEREYRLMEPMLRYLTIKVDRLALRAEEKAEAAARELQAKAAQAAQAEVIPPAGEESETADAAMVDTVPEGTGTQTDTVKSAEVESDADPATTSETDSEPEAEAETKTKGEESTA